MNLLAKVFLLFSSVCSPAGGAYHDALPHAGAEKERAIITVQSSNRRFKKTLRYLFNNNQFGQRREIQSIISGFDLNRDDVSTSDRPVGIKRNSGTTPNQGNVDLRYSRFFNFTERYRLEAFGEFQNLFNINRSSNSTTSRSQQNTFTGELVGGLPDFKARTQSTSQESRQMQLGFKFIF